MPAKVKGPTDHVVVVGAGLAGLSAALRLAGAGRQTGMAMPGLRRRDQNPAACQNPAGRQSV